MKTILSLSICLITLIHAPTVAQYTMQPAEGYDTQIGYMVSMLEDLKNRISNRVRELDVRETDYLMDEDANSIGSLIMHLAATEAYYQVESLEERSFTADEEAQWMLAAGLGVEARKQFKGRPIRDYLSLWDDVRQKTLEGLKKKDDAWFATKVDESVDHHWAWYHVMEHQANHMGQISLILNKIPDRP